MEANTERSEQEQLLLNEFKYLSAKLAGPTGIRRLIYSISSWISLNGTILFQYLGYNRKIAYCKRDKIILNIGCGDVVNDCYINTDLIPRLGDLVRMLLRKQKMNYQCFLNLTWEDKYLFNCADGIILAHVLEHIPPNLAIKALENCHKYLKENGSIRISVPFIGAYEQIPMPSNQSLTHKILAINSLVYGWQHRFMYDSELLALLMKEAGFKSITIVNHGEGILSDTDIALRAPETIYVTAQK